MVVLFLVFLKNLHSDCSPKWLCQFTYYSHQFPVYILLLTIPTNSTRGFPFFHTLSPHIIMAIDDGHSDWCEVIPHCSSDLHFSDNERCWASFHVFISHLYCLLRRSVWIFCPLFDWVVCFLGVELQELLVYFSEIDSQWEFALWLGELKQLCSVTT